MNSRRNFVKNSVTAGLSAALLPAGAQAALPVAEAPRAPWKHWVWTNPDPKDTAAELAERYKKYYAAGVRGIFFEADSEQHCRAAKAQKLEAHRWIWTMNRGEKSLLAAHPEWYAVNRKGESCATHPPYVDYYRWLCPSRPEVIQYLENDYAAALKKDYVDGAHLDYVRFCDVILPVNLWDNYKIVQTSELPEYDFCYCAVCKAAYKTEHGIDIDTVQFPEASPSWRRFRYQRVNRVVARLMAVAQTHRKPLTAAVFPTPDIAHRNVKQDWVNWNISGVCPMIYHGFYKENVAWIGQAVAEGVGALNGKFPLYAGLYLSDFKNDAEVQQGIELALRNGAAGVSLFGNVADGTLAALKSASANALGTK
ncbi:family 10 glycosylhydrolase [Hymenobacter sp. PAMC 26628]|uniref:family 10 glycosylhydrolase n=1 Tax=Hymenobacter sp. PAMC 26628 TaxID=1484118 RepID=UPI0007703E8F|nr:family 10 glycosylhydrolase [Hymenobacter sp. PAMC 26628]AMJ67040.1 Tat pathway signal protein [Hymenobacter sp. PAMC 26628]